MTSECTISEGYKETDIGIIPLNWNVKKVGDLFEIKNGTTPSTKEEKYWADGNINWITPTDLNKINSNKFIFQTLRKITPAALEECNLNILPKDSLIMSTRAPVGYVAIIGEQATFNQGCKGLVPKNDDVHSIYYYYYLQASAQKLQSISGGSTFKELSTSSLNNFYVPFFQKSEQHKIASILSKVDEHISHTEAIIEKTEELKKGLMQQLLAKGIGHTKFKKTEIGEIPEEWDVCEFNDYLDVKSGKGFKLSEYSESGIRLLRIDNVTYGKIKWDTVAYMPQHYAQNHPDLMLIEGDILLALNRPITQNKLKIGILTKEDAPAILYQRVGKIIFRKNINSLYVYYWLSKYLPAFISKKAVGSDQPFINLTDLRRLTFFVPNEEEQMQIAKVLSGIDTQLSQNQTYLSHLQELKKGLMQDLLTGKVRVTV